MLTTRTYQYPGAKFATIHFGDDHFEVVDGRVELPVSIGETTGWPVLRHVVGHADDAEADTKTRAVAHAQSHAVDPDGPQDAASRPLPRTAADPGFVTDWQRDEAARAARREIASRAEAEIRARREARTSSDATETALHTKYTELRHDGPTLEEFEAAGYAAEHYPPFGYAERHSARLAAYRQDRRLASERDTAAPDQAGHPVSDLQTREISEHDREYQDTTVAEARNADALAAGQPDPAEVVTGSVASVTAVVNATTSVDRLNAIAAAERADRNRTTVLDAIVKQIARL
jgi:hypothetical protein